MKTFLQAIATMEGFYSPGKIPQRSNNPGDLRYNNESISFGSTGSDSGYAIFPDVQTGWKALQRWLSVPAKFSPLDPNDGRPEGPEGWLIGGYLGATIEQALWRFSPPGDGDNNPTSYRDFVCAETGLIPTDILTLKVLETPEIL